MRIGYAYSDNTDDLQKGLDAISAYMRTLEERLEVEAMGPIGLGPRAPTFSQGYRTLLSH